MRKVQLQATIALRNIFRQPRRSGLTILAIAFSVFCIIIFQALKVGLHQKMIEGALNLDLGTIQIHAAAYQNNRTQFQTIPELDTLLRKVTNTRLTSMSLRIKAPALLLAGQGSSSVLLSGIRPDQEKNVTIIHQRVTGGTYLTPGADSLLIGQKLADSLNLQLGDKVTLMLQNVYGKPVLKKLSISGLYDTGLSSFDLSHLYLPLSTLQNLLETPNEVTEIAFSTKTATAGKTAARLADEFEEGKYQITPWQVMAPDLVQLMELNDATFNLLVIIIFFIVAMGIANTMNAVIFERFREFGTIAAIGTTPFEIISLVSFESFFLGIFACITGTCTALIVCMYLHIHGIDLSHFTSSNQYFAAGSVLKAYVLPKDIFSANAITLLTALLAGFYPAVKASVLHPVDALNYT